MSTVERLPTGAPGPYAKARPSMIGRYLLRTVPKAGAMAAFDTLLARPPRRRPVPATPERVLLANWGHLGDVVTAVGVARWLRGRFPNGRLDLMAASWGRAAAAASGLFDTIHVIDHPALNRSDASPADKAVRYRTTRSAALAAIRAADYQIGIDTYAFYPPAHPLFRSAGIPVRAGFTSGGWGPWLTHPCRWTDRAAPMADHYGDLLARLWPDRPLPPGAMRPHAERDQVPVPPAIADLGPYLVLHPGAGAPYKDWGEGRWLELIDLLRADPALSDHTLAITGAGAGEVAAAGRLAAVRTGLVNLAGQASWPEFVGIVAHAAAVVCPDTATSHVAAMLDVPVVAIFTGTNQPEQWGPYAARGRTVVQEVRCAPCNRAGCAAMACIRDTTAAQVLAALRRVTA